MTGLIIATHGDLAASALEAAELLVGEQEQVETIGFRPGDSLELLLERFTQAIKRLEDCEEILVLTDIKGGSPCNAATVMKAKNPKLRVVAGLSIPLMCGEGFKKPGAADSVPCAARVGSLRELADCIN